MRVIYEEHVDSYHLLNVSFVVQRRESVSGAPVYATSAHSGRNPAPFTYDLYRTIKKRSSPRLFRDSTGGKPTPDHSKKLVLENHGAIKGANEREGNN